MMQRATVTALVSGVYQVRIDGATTTSPVEQCDPTDAPPNGTRCYVTAVGSGLLMLPTGNPT